MKYIKECYGSSYLKYYEGGNHRYALEPILVRTKKNIAPLISTRQLRRWFYYSVENGETKGEMKMNKKTCHDYRRRVVYRVRGNKRKGTWTRHDTRYLKNIIKYMPHLYVFEITERMQIMSG